MVAVQWRQSLNRTSVGLKPESYNVMTPHGVVPQSNQRGIETSVLEKLAFAISLPQSNQRGIETS